MKIIEILEGFELQAKAEIISIIHNLSSAEGWASVAILGAVAAAAYRTARWMNGGKK